MNQVIHCPTCGRDYPITAQTPAPSDCDVCGQSLVGITPQDATAPEATIENESNCQCETPQPDVTGYCNNCFLPISPKDTGDAATAPGAVDEPTEPAAPSPPVQADQRLQVRLCIGGFAEELVTLPAILGRGSTSISDRAREHLQLQFGGVSEKHLSLTTMGQKLCASDLESTNGSYIIGSDKQWRQLPKHEAYTLPDSGVLRLGQHCIVQYKIEHPGGPAK